MIISSATTLANANAPPQLKRAVGIPGAVLMGLGSILGTGIFVSIGIAAEVTGPSVVLAVIAAALVATFNGLSSAQLAASHPVSGGTYEYGYRYLNPALGFTAGWMFLCAKSASAATAALGFAGYALAVAGQSTLTYRSVLALAAVVVLTLVVAGGIHRSNRANGVIVAVTLLALAAFVAFGMPSAVAGASAHLEAIFTIDASRASSFLHATALMFVAYTGYGRIATLGEEVRDPQRSIPRAMIVTLVTTAAIYVLVAFVAVGAAGADGLAQITVRAAAPLEVIARRFTMPAVAWVVAAGAVTAMLGVLLNLLLGLSRVVLAMARRGDMPAWCARIDDKRSSPVAAVLLVGAIIALLTAMGSIRTTWSFSAFTVLVYYALTNLAALRLPPQARLYPRWIPAAGLVCCLGLAFWVEPAIWAAGLGVIAAGLVWQRMVRRTAGRAAAEGR